MAVGEDKVNFRPLARKGVDKVFDWDKEWHEGYDPPKRFEWKGVVRQHPIEAGLSLLLVAALLVWWGIS